MTENKDIRWMQRFSNYNKAFKKLSEAVEFVELELKDQENCFSANNSEEEDEIQSEFMKEAVIQRFEYTHELAWNVMKDFLLEVGDIKVFGSKDATREAFQADLIDNGDVWMEMIKSRNKTSHTYNEETAEDIFLKVIHLYYPAFLFFQQKMEQYRSGQQTKLFD